MYDQGDKSKTVTSASNAERRGSGRRSFIAAANVVDLRSGAAFSTRATDLGPGGCFVDTLVPFDSGSKVRVSVREGNMQLDATGMVVYSQSGLGMGIAFDELEPEQRKVLAVWLGDKEESVFGESSAPSDPLSNPVVPHGSDRQALVRLVSLMVRKGILSEADATAIFGNPVLF
jgi:hypothetical protein